MKLKKIQSSTAIGVGMFFALLSFSAALVQTIYFVIRSGGDFSPITSAILLQSFVEAPLVLGVTGFVSVFIVIIAYNHIAKKYPISWEVSK